MLLIASKLKWVDYLLHNQRLNFLEYSDFSQFLIEMAQNSITQGTGKKDLELKNRLIFTQKVSKENR